MKLGKHLRTMELGISIPHNTTSNLSYHQNNSSPDIAPISQTKYHTSSYRTQLMSQYKNLRNHSLFTVQINMFNFHLYP